MATGAVQSLAKSTCLPGEPQSRPSAASGECEANRGAGNSPAIIVTTGNRNWRPTEEHCSGRVFGALSLDAWQGVMRLLATPPKGTSQQPLVRNAPFVLRSKR